MGRRTVIILGQPNTELPVYVVRKESGQGRKRTLHRNHLLPIGIINEEQDQETTTPRKPVPVPRRKPVPAVRPKPTPTPVEVSTDNDTESEDESLVYVTYDAPQQMDQPEDNVPLDVDTSVVDEADAPGNDDDDQDRTEEQDSGPEEDASSSEESGGSGLEDLQEDQAHNLTDESTAAGDEIDDDDDYDNDNDDIEPQPRRSTRTKTSTASTKYKDYVVPSVVKSAQPDWMVRADYLRTAASSGMFMNIGDEVSRAMLQLITRPDD